MTVLTVSSELSCDTLSYTDCRTIHYVHCADLFSGEGRKLRGLGDVKNELGTLNSIYFRGNVFGS